MADPAAPNLLVIRRHYVGDLVLLGSFLSNLRLHWPDARLTVLADEGYTEILSLNPDRPEVWEVPGGEAGPLRCCDGCAAPASPTSST